MLSEWWSMARLSLWEEEPCEPAKLEEGTAGRCQSSSASTEQNPPFPSPSFPLPTLCLPLLFPASSVCLRLFLPFVHLSFLSLFLCFFFSLLCPLYKRAQWFSTQNFLLWGFIPTVGQKSCTLKSWHNKLVFKYVWCVTWKNTIKSSHYPW